MPFLTLSLFLAIALNAYHFWPRAGVGKNNLVKQKNYGAYCVGEERPDSCYWFDEQGIVWNEAKTIVDERLLKIEEISDFQPSRGQSFLSKELIVNLIKILDFFRSSRVLAESIKLKRDDQELEAMANYPETGLKTRVLFNLRFNPQNNLTGLTVFLKKYKPKDLEYIDLRVENKIFYK